MLHVKLTLYPNVKCWAPDVGIHTDAMLCLIYHDHEL